MNENLNSFKSHLFVGCFSFVMGICGFLFATGQFTSISIVQSDFEEIGTTGEIREIENPKETFGQRDKGAILKDKPVAGGNREAEVSSSKPAKPTDTNKVNPALIEDVDCSKINLPNKDAEEKAKYACSLHANSIMLASFHQEAGRNEWAKGKLGEMGICQLMQNKTNKVFINDSRWDDWRYQVEVCVSKWKAVPNQKKIRASYGSSAYKKYLHYFK